MLTPIKRITLLYMRTIVTTADNFKAKGIQQGCHEFYDFKNLSNIPRYKGQKSSEVYKI